MRERESRSILLVEDDPNDVLLIRRAFRKIGSETPLNVVEDGERAVAWLDGQGNLADRDRYPQPDLLLLDLKLPRLSGFEVLQWLRGKDGLRRLPVIVLTGSRETSDVNRALDLGANSYLAKPVGFEALLDIVRMLDLYWLTYNERPTLNPS
ncbi:MAG TPA: response regulator [Thermoanaerobaculia bacterium]|nr:response regulator [Thermoanaerobaculia bacterium]